MQAKKLNVWALAILLTGLSTSGHTWWNEPKNGDGWSTGWGTSSQETGYGPRWGTGTSGLGNSTRYDSGGTGWANPEPNIPRNSYENVYRNSPRNLPWSP